MRWLPIALIAGCSFSGDGAGTTVDAGDADAFESDPCDPDWAPASFDPCSIEPTAPLIISGEAIYDTGALTLTVGGTVTDLGGILTLDPNVALVYAASVTIEAGGHLRVVGSRPLLLASARAIDVDGLLDVGAALAVGGPGSKPAACDVNPPTKGENDDGGAGGGGGGGFASDGGDGNDGDDDGVNGGDHGDRGLAVALPATPHGGCPGGLGGDGNGTAGGVGGGGGGALQLSAHDSVGVGASGAIDARGGGGGGGAGDDAGGGGGGSGGYVRLDAPELLFDNGASITANGGSGGGGAGGGSAGGPGLDGSRGLTAVAGGSGGSGEGEGGEGGARASGDEGKTPPGNPNGGGGGGGGSVGFIVVDRPINPSAGVVISPAPTVLPSARQARH